MVLAACSPNTEPTINTDTYIDAVEQCLAKVITTEKQNKLYIFSSDPSMDLDFNVILLPSNQNFSTNSKDIPLIISPIQAINKIHITINN